MSAQIQQQEPAQQPPAIAEVNTAVAEFDRVAAGIGALKQQYAGVVFDVATTAGMKAACEARVAIRAPRYEVERVRKAVKAPLLKLGKDIDARAAQITAELLALEQPVDDQIKNEERRREEERKAKAESERKRIAAINDDIEQDLRCVPASMVGRSAADLDRTILDIVAIEITENRFAEFTQLASAVKASTLGKLREMHTRQLAHEAEQERLHIEREELERQRLANEAAAKAERERLAAEQAEAARKHQEQQQELERQRAAQEEANRIERERIAAKEAGARAKREAEEAEARRKREADEAESKRQIDEQTAKLRAERENNERIAREQQEAAQAEHARISAENARQAEELRRQQESIEAQRAELERQQQQIAASQQVEPSPVAQPSLATEPETVADLSTTMAPQSLCTMLGPNFTPTRVHMVAIIALDFGVSQAVAEGWLVREFGGAA